MLFNMRIINFLTVAYRGIETVAFYSILPEAFELKNDDTVKII
jgi:hypothetical protein